MQLCFGNHTNDQVLNQLEAFVVLCLFLDKPLFLYCTVMTVMCATGTMCFCHTLTCNYKVVGFIMWKTSK